MIPENENEREGITEIMELLHKYVPNCVGGSKDIKKIGFAGDQLTVERARNCQLIRAHSDSQTEALQGLMPFASDWHAELTILQVCSLVYPGHVLPSTRYLGTRLGSVLTMLLYRMVCIS